ncbi:beta strand repeat-containing protein [Flavobacterium sp. RHBU_24]|uniref:beta strand repeat-containing protein n=1 Tax=Flavobacterium sp. RHBU_24 TaxID=3391185 RepID=UPI003984C804
MVKNLQFKNFNTLLLVLMLFFSIASWGQSIWTNPITGTNPNTANPFTTGDVKDTNITVSGISRGTGITGSGANDRYNANSWNTASIDLTAYFEFTLTPGSGYEIDLTSFVYTAQASNTSINSFAFRSSLDGYTSNIGTPTVSGATISLSGTNYQNLTSAITFRFYAWGAGAAGNTFSINDFTFNGSVSLASAPGQVITPEITASGTANGTDTFWSTASITLSTTTPGASIYYTTDGSTPTTGSTPYTVPFAINATSTIKAIAVASGLTDSAVASKTITITTPPTAALPYSEAFTNTLGSWTNKAVTGNRPWLANANGASANGYNVSPSVESWLISPKLTGVTNGMAISFDYQVPFTGDALQVLYSTNYDGYSPPSTATWLPATSITATVSPSFVNTGSLIVPATENVHIGLKYTGTSSGGYSSFYVKNFTAALSAPSVTTTQVVTTTGTITSATSGGSIPYANGTVSHKGVVWDTAANPTTALTTKTDDGTGSSAFTSTLSPLLSNTLYYYRAYAENENGTAYGTEYSFTTRAYAPGTPTVSNPQSSTLDVTLAENGNNAATKYAIRINGGIYTNYFVQANGSVNNTEVFQTVAEWGSTTVTVTGLAPETTYTFDVRAQNTLGDLTDYSATAAGTTAESTVPSLILTSASLDFGSICLYSYTTGSFSFTGTNISGTATLDVAALEGYSYSLTETGSYTSTLTIPGFTGSEVTVWARLTPTAVQSHNGTIQVAGQDANSTAVLDLATTGEGINTPGTVTTIAATGTTSVAATLNGSAATACSLFSAYGFEYSTTSGFANGAGTPVTAGNFTTGTFSAAISSLTPNTTYYYKAFITDGAGTHYGSQLSFTTEALVAPVATEETDVTQTSFTANWQAVTGATGYRLDVSTLAAFGTGNLATDLFFSEYTEGATGSEKYVEIYNGTGHTINLSDYRLRLYVNGASTIASPGSNDVQLSGTLQNGQTAVYRNGSATGYPAAASLSPVNFNGDDTIVLYKISTDSNVDIFGNIGEDPGTAWTAAGGYSTADKTLVRKSTVYSGVTVDPTGTGFPTLATEWDVFTNTTTSLGSHTGNFVPNYITGYNDLAVTGTTQAVSIPGGLTPGTNYYYRVRAYSSTNTSENSNTITATTRPDTVTWTGTPAAWVPNVTPDNTISVIIDADYDTATNGSFIANNLTINAGSALTVNPNTTLTLFGAVTNNAGVDNVVVEDNGAIIQRGTGVNDTPITIIKNSNPLYRLDYTLWSAPTTGQTLRVFSMGTSNNRFYEYISSATEVTGYYPVDPLTTSFTTENRGKSFLIRMPNTITTDVTGSNGTTTPAQYVEGTGDYIFEGVFKGTPNTGDITFPLYNVGPRYTAIGNPYPSPINLAGFYTANSGVIDQGSALYFWRKRNNAAGDTGSYATLTLADFNANDTGDNDTNNTGGQNNGQYYAAGSESNWAIAPAQGFIVQTAATAPSNPVVTFNNDMRQAAPATGGQAFFRTGISQVSRYRMRVTTPAGGASQMSVVYTPQGTLGLDYGYDGKKLGQPGLSLYTLAESTPLAIQARPEFDATDVVPVGFTAATAGSFTIAISHTDGVFANGQKIYLKDNTEGIIRDMELGNYTFTSEAGTFEGRFDVVYTTSALGTDTPVLDANTVIVYQNAGTININSGTALISSINVFDIRGRKLYAADKINATEAAINNLTAAQQVLIVEVATDKGTVTKKIVF